MNDLLNKAFPVIRRVYPSTIRSDIVNVQPMKAPSSLLFYKDFEYRITDPIFTQAGLETVFEEID